MRLVFLDSTDEFVIAPVDALTFFGTIGDLVATSAIFEFFTFFKRLWNIAPVAPLESDTVFIAAKISASQSGEVFSFGQF